MRFSSSRIGRHRALTALVLALAIVCQPALLAVEPGRAGSATLHGTILGSDGVALAGARVVVYHLATEQVLNSGLTGSDGEFRVDNLPDGYYDVAVQTADGLFVVDRVVRLGPDDDAEIVLRVSPSVDGRAPRDFPAFGETPIGTAIVQAGGRGAFWGTPTGISLIAGGGLLSLLALSNGGSSSNNTAVNCTSGGVSPTCP